MKRGLGDETETGQSVWQYGHLPMATFSSAGGRPSGVIVTFASPGAVPAREHQGPGPEANFIFAAIAHCFAKISAACSRNPSSTHLSPCPKPAT